MKRSIVLLVLALATFGLAAPAQASSGAIVVTGVQTPVDGGECFDPDSIASYEMTGGLLGCWYIDEITSEKYQPSGTAFIAGTETFIGCIDADGDGECDGESGEFHTTFTFTAKFASDGSELHGRCHHPITTGSGVFANAKGLINFTDNTDVDPVTADYSGPISL